MTGLDNPNPRAGPDLMICGTQIKYLIQKQKAHSHFISLPFFSYIAPIFSEYISFKIDKSYNHLKTLPRDFGCYSHAII